MSKTNGAMPKKSEEISTSALSEMAMENKKIPDVDNFSIGNDLLKIADIFS